MKYTKKRTGFNGITVLNSPVQLMPIIVGNWSDFSKFIRNVCNPNGERIAQLIIAKHERGLD
jgi:hypothetical protein